MALKIDLKKAYDRLRWSFIRETLELASFPKTMIKLVMDCITNAKFQVL